MKLLRCLLLGSIITFVAACTDDGDNNDPPPPAATTELRVLHGSPDAPDVNVLIDGDSMIEALPFEAGTGFTELEAGSYSVQVDGIAPDGSSIEAVIGPLELMLGADTETTVIATGYLAPGEGQPAIGESTIVVTQPKAAAVADTASVTAVHAAPNAPAVDVYITTPADPIDGAEPATQFEFGTVADPLSLPAGDYRVRVTLAGDPAAVVFDSGETGLTVPGGASLLVAAIQNTGPGESPIKLAVLDGESSSVLLDAATPATLKAAHSAPGVGPVDVFATPSGATAIEIFSDLPYAGTGTLCAVTPDTYRVDVAPDGAGVAGSVINAPEVTLEAGKVYSAVATIVDEVPTLLLTEDADRPIATQALLKAIHGAPAAGAVDVYITAAGEITTDDIVAGAVTPTLDDFEVGEIGDYLAVAPGSYDVRVVPSADPTLVAINVENLPIAAGQVITAIARGPETIGPEPADFNLIVLDNALCAAD